VALHGSHECGAQGTGQEDLGEGCDPDRAGKPIPTADKFDEVNPFPAGIRGDPGRADMIP